MVGRGCVVRRCPWLSHRTTRRLAREQNSVAYTQWRCFSRSMASISFARRRHLTHMAGCDECLALDDLQRHATGFDSAFSCRVLCAHRVGLESLGLPSILSERNNHHSNVLENTGMGCILVGLSCLCQSLLVFCQQPCTSNARNSTTHDDTARRHQRGIAEHATVGITAWLLGQCDSHGTQKHVELTNSGTERPSTVVSHMPEMWL